MAFETLNGIVLRYANYRDNDRILTVLTQERGAVAVTVRNCRKKSSVTADAVSEQCCYGEFVVYERGGILYASSTAIKESFYPIVLRKLLRITMAARNFFLCATMH